jgi:hypothetical protein
MPRIRKAPKPVGNCAFATTRALLVFPDFLRGVIEVSIIAGLPESLLFTRTSRAPTNQLTTSRASDARSLYIAACFG